MTHLIAKITFKIFMLILGVMIVITSFFATVSYVDTIDAFEKAEMNHLKSVVKIQALYLESMEIEVDSAVSGQEEYQVLRSKLKNYLTNANRLNQLEGGLSLILVRNQDDLTEIISSGSVSSLEKADPIVRSILEDLPLKPLEKGMDQANEAESLFYAYPIAFSKISAYHGYLFIEENISENLSEARTILFRRLVLAFLMIALLGFLGKRYLNRILRHEVIAKKKLSDYASLAEDRNKELERLSFVLGKSDNIILLTDQDGKIEWLNQKAKSINNFSAEELESFIGRELAEVSHYSKIKEVIEIVNRTKKKHIYQAKSYDQYRQEHWSSTTVTPILDENNEVVNLLFVDADITKLKMAELEISKLANFTQENSNALMRFTKNGEVLFANDPGKTLLNHWGARVNGILEKPSILKTIRLAAELEQEQKLNLESNNRIYSLRFHPVSDKNYINVYAEDITEIKLAEKAYRDRASMIEKHNLNITDSINYAKRIQDAIIPGEDHIRKYFTDSFFIYRPKDIVSGDFVWLHELKPKEEYLFALADCTGHGVPGAMMSIIGHSLLNEIVEGGEITDPALILDELNKEVIKTLRQKTDGESSDGMDVSIIKINIPELTITFAGAYQDMYWMNGKLSTFKGDRQPIGGKHHILDRKFQNQCFKISKGDSIFLASDGFVDQFGGPEDKKFLKKRFSKLISSNYKYSMQAQSFIYEKAFEDWKGPHEQIDDISVVGIKF
jgi:PAS domain S-box-containing protein